MLILQIVIALIIARIVDTRIVRPALCGETINILGYKIRTSKQR